MHKEDSLSALVNYALYLAHRIERYVKKSSFFYQISNVCRQSSRTDCL